MPTLVLVTLETSFKYTTPAACRFENNKSLRDAFLIQHRHLFLKRLETDFGGRSTKQHI